LRIAIAFWSIDFCTELWNDRLLRDRLIEEFLKFPTEFCAVALLNCRACLQNREIKDWMEH